MVVGELTINAYQSVFDEFLVDLCRGDQVLRRSRAQSLAGAKDTGTMLALRLLHAELEEVIRKM